MQFFLSTTLVALLLGSCGYSMDGSAEYFEDECGCIEYSESGGKIDYCARKQGDSLKWGFIDSWHACKIFLPFIYDGATSFNNGLAGVKLNNKWGVIDSTGKIKIECKFSDLKEFSDSLAAFKNDQGRWGFINTEGDTILEAKFTVISNYFGNLTVTYEPEKEWKVYNTKGQVLPVQIDSIAHNDYSGGETIYIGHYWANGEVFEYPFYLHGEKVKLIGAQNKYAVVSDTVDTRLSEIERLVATEQFKPIFK